MLPVRRALRVFTFAFVLPLLTHAGWWMSREQAPSWNAANWSSAGVLPAASAKPEATVHVFCARTGRWRGVFAHHCWVVLKERGAARYARYDKVGWGRPVRENNWPADGRWFSNPPETIAAFAGADAERLIPKIRAAIASYPHNAFGDYTIWPGPNSNSFIVHVLAAIPEAHVALPPTALGKDFRNGGWFAGLAPSGTGVQVSALGMAGVTLAWLEGVEINLLGLVTGLDIRRPALKLPGWGRVGL
jgi:hypothetical protein